MDAELWSTLPRDILFSIIWYANNDFDTKQERRRLLSKWRLTVLGDPVFHRAVLLQHWASATIVWRDMMYESHLFMPRRYWLGDRHGLAIELLLDNKGLRPAEFVRRLHLDLSNPHRDRWRCCHRDVRYTMNALLPAMRSLRELNIRSPPTNTIFETLSAGEYPQLKVLEVDQITGYHLAGHISDPDYRVYDWTRLSRLTSLQELILQPLTLGECGTFLSLIVALPCLQSLDLSAVPPILTWGHAYRSSLKKILDSEEVATDDSEADVLPNLLAKLPSGLRRLVLRDVAYEQDPLQIPDGPHDKDSQLSQCFLEELFMEHNNAVIFRNALRWLPNATLKRLSFSPVMHAQAEAGHGGGSPWDIINGIISTYQKSLQELCFNNFFEAPQDLVHTFDKNWGHKFEIVELVTVNYYRCDRNCQWFYSTWHNIPPQHLLFGCSQNTSQWGLSLQRIRLDSQSYPGRQNFSIKYLLRCVWLKNLRILVFDTKCSQTQTLPDDGWYQSKADEIAAEAATTLRVLVICGRAFWTDHGSQTVGASVLDSDHAGSSLTRARRFFPEWRSSLTEEQKTIIRHYRLWRTQEDADFLDPPSGNHRVRTVYDNVYGGWRWSSPNFLIARRRNVQ